MKIYHISECRDAGNRQTWRWKKGWRDEAFPLRGTLTVFHGVSQTLRTGCRAGDLLLTFTGFVILGCEISIMMLSNSQGHCEN